MSFIILNFIISSASRQYIDRKLPTPHLTTTPHLLIRIFFEKSKQTQKRQIRAQTQISKIIVCQWIFDCHEILLRIISF
jgi:hypothetical protein